jgi:drug/metabolite transporter (DMT)-like permease
LNLQNRHFKAHLFVFAASLIYGANYSIAKLVMPEYIQPFGFIILRVWTSAILFFMMWRFLSYEKIEKQDRLRLFFCAVFGVAVNQLFFFKGLSLTGPVNAGLIMVTNPIFVLVLGIIFLSELFTWRKLFGVLSGLAGALLLIIYSGKDIHSGNSAIGDLYILLNSLSYAVYLVMVKPLMKKYHPYTIMATVFATGAVLVLPFGWNELLEIRWETFTPGVITATAFVIIATTFFAYLFNTLGLAVLSPSVVSIYIYLQPLLAAGFAMLLSSQYPGWIHLLSAILVFAGVYLSTTAVRQPKRTVQ